MCDGESRFKVMSHFGAGHLHAVGAAKLSSDACAADRGYGRKFYTADAVQVASAALLRAADGDVTLGAALTDTYVADGLHDLTVVFADAHDGVPSRAVSAENVEACVEAHPRGHLLLILPSAPAKEAARVINARARLSYLTWAEAVVPLTQCAQVSPVTRLSPQDVRAYEAAHNVEASSLPAIRRDDIVARWHGWNRGDVVVQHWPNHCARHVI